MESELEHFLLTETLTPDHFSYSHNSTVRSENSPDLDSASLAQRQFLCYYQNQFLNQILCITFIGLI